MSYYDVVFNIFLLDLNNYSARIKISNVKINNKNDLSA